MGVKLNFKRSQIVKMVLRCLFLFALVFGSFLADPARAKSLLDQGKDGQEYSVNNPCMEYRCSRIFSPVCGSDGVTHGNMCLFEMTQCFMRQEGSELTIAHEGPCQEEYAMKDPCMKVCPRIPAPVCDSEGKTHSNLCEFEVYQCFQRQDGHEITLVRDGACEEEFGVADILNKCLKTCDKIHKPVCDSEGITHTNLCEFEIRQCVAYESSGRKVTLDHEGVCTKEYGVAEVLNKCLKTCDKIHKPVCDNEGITHTNLCQFEIRQCVAYESSGRKVTLDHEGVCTKEYGVAEVLNKCLK